MDIGEIHCSAKFIIGENGKDSKVVVIDLNDDLKVKKIFEGHEGGILSLNVHEENKLLATSSTDGSIRIYCTDQQILIKGLGVINKSNDIETAPSLAQIAWDLIENLLAILVKNSIVSMK